MKQQNNPPYNPLDKLNLGRSVANALLASELQALPPDSFQGAGIYAIYYYGSNPLYQWISAYNNNPTMKELWPIYIGKAGGSGSRKGSFDLVNTGNALFNRIRKHSYSIEAGAQLDLGDFKCRYLTIDSIWIPLGEQLLIQKFQPLWNHTIDGFGNNDPGARRKNQYTSPWDLLHPGRNYANQNTGNPGIENLDLYKDKIIRQQKSVYDQLVSSGGGFV